MYQESTADFEKYVLNLLKDIAQRNNQEFYIGHNLFNQYRNKDPSGRVFRLVNLTEPKGHGSLTYEWRGITQHWRLTKEKMESLEMQGRIVYSKNGVPRLKQYLDELVGAEGAPIQNIWAPWDGYAPDGLLDIDGPLVIKIGLRFNIHEFKNLTLKYSGNVGKIKNILIISKNHINSNVLNTVIGTNITIWDSQKLFELSDKFPEVYYRYNYKNLNLALKNYEQLNYGYNNAHHIDNLKYNYKNGDVVLFLGSGVSKGASKNLPDWETLLKRLISRIIEDNTDKYTYNFVENYLDDTFSKLSPIALGRFIRKALGSDEKFIKELRNSIYTGYKREINKESTLHHIAKLCIQAENGFGLSAIVTYNYDDLLEFYLDKMGVEYLSITQPNEICTFNQMPIYHVHGFLPYKKHITKEMEKAIIFGEYEYHAQYIESYSWQNLLQLNLLREKTVLFIGMSMKDPNLRRLLDIAYNYSKNQKHYAILDDHWAFKEEGLSNMLRSMEERTFEDLGTNIIWYREVNEINQILNAISREQ